MIDGRRKKVLTVLCLGSAFLAWRGYVSISERLLVADTRAGPIGVEVAPIDPKSEAAVKADVVLANLLDQQSAVADQPWGRDPFGSLARSVPVEDDSSAARQVALDRVPPPAPPVQFTGVSRSDSRWLAVVRDQIVRVGDVIEGRYTVVEITKRSITLAADGWTYRYELGVESPEVRPLTEEP